MQLGEIITELEKYDPEALMPLGFEDPHSNSAFWDHLGFVPVRDVSVKNVLTECRWALGREFPGQYQGLYTATTETPCRLSDHGEMGDDISPLVLRLMLMFVPKKDS